MTLPLPASPAARERGCSCPVMDNHGGRGVPTANGPAFWVDGDCPQHGYAAKEE